MLCLSSVISCVCSLGVSVHLAALYSLIEHHRFVPLSPTSVLIREPSSKLGCGSYQLMQMGRIQSDDMLHIDSKIL